jgi:anti-anti-sigma regulatory factor
MPTQITQIEDPLGNRTILRVAGSLTQLDAELIERISTDLIEGSAGGITIDLAEVDFLDSDGASILVRLKNNYPIEIEGIHLLVQNAIDVAERDPSGSR